MENPIKEYLRKQQESREDLARRNPENKPTKFNTILRIAVAIYLLYSVYGMIPGIKESTGGQRIFFIVASIAFVGFSVYFIVDGIRHFMKKDFFDPNAQEDSEEAEAEQEPENAPEKRTGRTFSSVSDTPTRSLSQMAKLPETSQVPEDEQE